MERKEKKMSWQRPDERALSIECPKCGTTLTSREMHERGLACPGNCGVRLTRLASECSRRWQPLSYLLVDKTSGAVKYVGTTGDLRRRLSEHCSAKGKLIVDRPMEDTIGVESEKQRQKTEATLEQTGTRVHVALHACEWMLWSTLWEKPKLNLSPPPNVDSVKYRSLRRTADGGTEVVTYRPTRCKHEHADALQLASSSRYARAQNVLRERTGFAVENAEILARQERENWRYMKPLWCQKRKTRTPKEIDAQLGEVEMPGVGRLAASSEVMIGGKGDTQHAWALGRLVRTHSVSAGSWPYMRQGDCEKLGFFGYCRCRVPCGQRWVLTGEPEARRQQREATAFAWYADPWRKHGVMGTDDEEIMDKLEMAFEIEAESERLREAGQHYQGRTTELSMLTREITELRAKDYYGAAYDPACTCLITQNARHKYLHDREVK